MQMMLQQQKLLAVTDLQKVKQKPGKSSWIKLCIILLCYDILCTKLEAMPDNGVSTEDMFLPYLYRKSVYFSACMKVVSNY
jgi:hypothetical protein